MYGLDWTDGDECAFIDGLGTHRFVNPAYPRVCTPEARLALLERYALALRHREEWGRLHPERIQAYLDEAIAREIRVVVARSEGRLSALSDVRTA
ncbi:MAG TPA: hypothetical protein VNI83_02590 [Vicinamibacterales bacterium]|nr:hypothetical protein [Vicinamibacterales bacterium]